MVFRVQELEVQVRTRSIILGIFALVFVQTAAFSQNLEDFVSTGAPAEWVRPQTVPAAEDVEFKTRYVLVDRQYRATETSDDRYYRYVDAFNTPNDVKDGSTISVSLDPEYDTVTFHHIRLIRDGQVKDLLDLAKFDFYRIETERNRMIYNGTMEMAYHVPDVRIGDRLDFAYTHSGKNPAFLSNFQATFKHQYGADVEKIHGSLLIDKDLPVYYTSLSGAEPPRITDEGEFARYSWTIEPAPKKIVDDNIPWSHIPRPKTQFSTYSDWSDVGELFAEHYRPNAPTKDIADIISEIQVNADTKAKRLRAALGFVQREIRYLGIELGVGGYVPRAPETVLARRFGDCKDMTLLLITLLDGLDIHAVPVLVDTDYRNGITNFQPSPTVFNHVIVMADLDGKTYFLDPTRGEQLGDLDHLQQADFGKGVVVAPDSPGIVQVIAPKPKFFRSVVDIFDMRPNPGDLEFTHSATYHMETADSYWTWIRNNPIDEINKSYLDRFQQRYPTLEQNEPIEIEVDPETATVKLTAHYTIRDAWIPNDDGSARYFDSYAQDIYRDMPDFSGVKRTAPFALKSSIRTEQTIRFLLSGSWDLPPETESFDLPALKYEKRTLFLNNIYTSVFTYETKTDRIESQDFKETMAAIKKMDKSVDVSLERYDMPAKN